MAGAIHVGAAAIVWTRGRRARGGHRVRLRGAQAWGAWLMPVTGVVVLGFVLFHLLDLTLGIVPMAPAGFVPWFDVPGRRSAPTVLVTGHWSALGLRVQPNLLALDSGCLWGGPLSAIRLEDRALFQVPCAAEDRRD